MQAKLGQLAICVALAGMAALLNGCGGAKALPTCDDGFFKDKHGHEVVASATAVPGLDDPIVKLLCKSQDGPKVDGYVRSYKTYHYKGNNPLTCHAKGSHHSIPGASSVTIHCPRNHKGWVVSSTGEEAKGMTLSDECVEEQERTYTTCNDDGDCSGDCAVLKKGVKGIPMKDAPNGDCCTLDQECQKRDEESQQRQFSNSGASDERLYEATGWFFSEVPISTSLPVSAAAIAAVVGLVIGARRVYGTHQAVDQALPRDSIEEGEE